MVEVLCYKLEGRGFDSRWGSLVFFSAPNPSSHTMAPGFSQPVREMSTCKARPAFKADNLTAICEPIVWTTWDP
jgi:hypothetical protein